MTPTAALADCSTAVNTAPTRIPSTGLVMVESMEVNQLCLPRSLTAPLMALMPNISTAKPMRISPTLRRTSFLENSHRQMPTMETTPVSVVVEKMPLSPVALSI